MRDRGLSFPAASEFHSFPNYLPVLSPETARVGNSETIWIADRGPTPKMQQSGPRSYCSEHVAPKRPGIVMVNLGKAAHLNTGISELTVSASHSSR